MTWQYVALKVALRILRLAVRWIDDVLEDPEDVIRTGRAKPNTQNGTWAHTPKDPPPD